MRNMKKLTFGAGILASTFVAFAAWKCPQCGALYPFIKGRPSLCSNCGNKYRFDEYRGSDAAKLDIDADLEAIKDEEFIDNDRLSTWFAWELNSLCAYIKDVRNFNGGYYTEDIPNEYFTHHNHDFGDHASFLGCDEQNM